MNLRQLKYFVSVVEAGNMTRAAEQLHVAQTALGMQIRQIEEDLGIELLVRHSRGIEPTKAGSLLHTRALAILKLVEETRKEVATCDREESETIRLGITPALMMIAGSEIILTVAGSSVMPYFAVIDEVRAGTLDARPVTMPAIRRTLFLASSKHQGPFRNEAGLTGAVRSSLSSLLDALGPLAHPLWVRTA